MGGGADGRGVASPVLWLPRAKSLMVQWGPFLCGWPGTSHGMLVPRTAKLEYSSISSPSVAHEGKCCPT